jgi:HSP20 family protein
MLYNPVYEFERMREVLDDVFSGISRNPYREKASEQANVYEGPNGYMLQFPAPGVNSGDVDVHFSNGILSVKMKRELEKKDPNAEKVLRMERSSLDFTRGFNISQDADIENINAKLVNGMLMVHVPKKEESKPKKIAIEVK